MKTHPLRSTDGGHVAPSRRVVSALGAGELVQLYSYTGAGLGSDRAETQGEAKKKTHASRAAVDGRQKEAGEGGSIQGGGRPDRQRPA